MKKIFIMFAVMLVSVMASAQKYWEVGIGATVTTQQRVGFSDFIRSDAGYSFNMKLSNSVWGFNIYGARELTPMWYLDIRNDMMFTSVTADGSTKIADMVGVGAQWRPFGSGQIQPYVRVGINYMYRGYEMRYIGSEGSVDSQMSWVLNAADTDDNQSNLVPISAGLGVNMWVTHQMGIGISADYLIMPQSGVKNSVTGAVRLLWRFSAVK